MDTTNAVPNPGSYRAEQAGCTCPVTDNHYGEGVPTKDGVTFWINGDCPVHAPKSPSNATIGVDDDAPRPIRSGPHLYLAAETENDRSKEQ